MSIEGFKPSPYTPEQESHRWEENPFEDEGVAREWIQSIENESGMIRDKETYPRLVEWIEGTHANTLVEIGSGQGICADRAVPDTMRYIGIEPSQVLTQRAQELYSKPNREFVLGNAYELPLSDNSADAAFSVNVWFHLENLSLASQELHRILKDNAPFLISTANPKAYSDWETLYEGTVREGKKLQGKANVPVTPLSKSIFYQHTLEEIVNALNQTGLSVDHIEPFGYAHLKTNEGLFIDIVGHKK